LLSPRIWIASGVLGPGSSRVVTSLSCMPPVSIAAPSRAHGCCHDPSMTTVMAVFGICCLLGTARVRIDA